MKMSLFRFQDDGSIPNNSLPVILYSDALKPEGSDPAILFESRFKSFGWTEQWRNGIYTFHHYHSTSHEVLGCYCGSAHVLLGGEHGELLQIKAGKTADQIAKSMRAKL